MLFLVHRDWLRSPIVGMLLDRVGGRGLQSQICTHTSLNSFHGVVQL